MFFKWSESIVDRGRQCLGGLVVIAAAVTLSPAISHASDLSDHYRSLQQQLISSGRLNDSRQVPMQSVPPAELVEGFEDVALSHEYRRSELQPLMRWEVPVRFRLAFGPSVAEPVRAKDREAIQGYISRLRRATKHDISLGGANGNFTILVASDHEIHAMGNFIRDSMPGIGNSTVNKIRRMPKELKCMVVVLPYDDPTKGIRSAIAIVRAEHTGLMRQSCIEEELAQGLGVPNDFQSPYPSIFNDDEAYALLTEYDEAILGILYDPALASGMLPETARAMARKIAPKYIR